MNLRLIGGKYKGRLLKSPKTSATRPTSAILRKSVFDICAPWIENAHFLDLFAGSGAMGLEALSRGASHVTFIEKDRQAIQCIEENLALLKAPKESYDLVKGDTLQVLKKLTQKKRQFDILYLDPPYALKQGKLSIAVHLVLELDRSPLLAPKAILFVEEGTPSQLHPEQLALLSLRYLGQRRFSTTLLHEFRNASSE